jgi:hypothetical protein
MDTLPSQLCNEIADEEPLARFLNSTSQYKKSLSLVKSSAFMPGADHETSVFRHGSEPRDSLWAIGTTVIPAGRNLHGAAIIKSSDVRSCQLDVIADEPPPKHAVINKWPNDNDPEKQNAKVMHLATLLASKAELFLK